ncbi:hypothetical protein PAPPERLAPAPP_02570 [Brevundimonas phage vB_BpoS-Papperlapapp]|uniref:Uncharacterized protein n=2 Tax=Marchewkavirus TaxID=3425052 RepID=A0A9E7SJL4_9CAUD|nr:hypothetical protein KABACHOK_00940 [Brevundimonas phage vB_BpoS-Kabachok]USN14627.1 hypothetical protein DOMOVOI_01530 [Brevundimonas phage vB_BpoS-Domovoi]USN15998.1 hypothetical protein PAPPERLAPAPP_02570 [Brevundimonas phage vB_BpoS-Papperlapapp]
MATLKTMNRRRRRKIEPGIVVEVYEVRGDCLCSAYERHQGRHIRRVTLKGEPYRVCSDPHPISEEEAARLAIDWDAFQWD